MLCLGSFVSARMLDFGDMFAGGNNGTKDKAESSTAPKNACKKGMFEDFFFFFFFEISCYTLSYALWFAETGVTVNQCRPIFSPSENCSTLQVKNLHPMGANSFLVEKIPFQKGIGLQKAYLEATKLVS